MHLLRRLLLEGNGDAEAEQTAGARAAAAEPGG
jgi:hypothetical protein